MISDIIYLLLKDRSIKISFKNLDPIKFFSIYVE